MENTPDLENERHALLDLIHESTDQALLRALALVPAESQQPEAITVTTSTEGTGYARAE